MKFTYLSKRYKALVQGFSRLSQPAFALSSALILAAGPAQADEILLHAFRGPSMGLEFRQEHWGLHVGLYPTTLDQNADGQSRTTWFLRSGLNYYQGLWQDPFWGEGGLYGGVSLMQGLNNAWNVSDSVLKGSGVMSDIGLRWRFWQQLDARLGVAALVGFDGRWSVNPTPGLSCALEI